MRKHGYIAVRISGALHANTQDIASRVIDVLPIIDIESVEDINGIRFREIECYLAGRDIPWVALDDDDGLFPHQCRNLIICEAGFTSKEEAILRNKLKD
ncbi:hypothetical protein GCM10011430_28090 [Oxalicibacterium solurbis]|uniref:Uncharacterized protein n=1 Tax=Oxalicibacterium solurbis TaxID=69280 RepID=A0A8J3B5T4_9BURK|nr:hypothetical protein GCM10011430_28090 [Oxalicibacterium solurbis]